MRHRLPICVTAISVLVACSATDPSMSASVAVIVSTSGVDLPAGPFTLLVDGTTVRAVPVNGGTVLVALRQGQRLVSLGGVPRNCSIAEGPDRQVEVIGAGQPQLIFRVTCDRAMASLTIRVDPVGMPTPGVPFVLTLDDGQVLTLREGEATTVQVGYSGARYIGLTTMPRNCHGPPSIGPIYLAPLADSAITVAVRCPRFGSGIAYSRIREGDWANRIYRARPDGSQEELLGMAWAHHYDPAISPTGDLIAFSTIRSGLSGRGLAVMTADGVRERLLAGGSGLPGYRTVRAPVWSPDGERLLAIGTKDVGLPTFAMFDATTGIAADLGIEATGIPDWNPLNGLLALPRPRPGVVSSAVWVVQASGEDGRWLQDRQQLRWDVHAVAWSPDGTKLAAVVQSVGNTRLAVIDVATGDSRIVYEYAFVMVERPAWSPDGSHLLFAAFEPEVGVISLVAVDVVSGTAVKLFAARSPVWR